MDQGDLFKSNDPPPKPTQPKRTPKMEPAWLKVVGDEFEKPYMTELRAFLLEEKKRHTVYPKGDDIFNAFWYTPFDQVRVVILGQDPYHGPNQAHGLCFSVLPGIPPPPSLVNIFKELNSDLGVPVPNHGCLTSWAQQGVFLLNTSLTVRQSTPQSHAGKGWETFTDRVISALNKEREQLVFMLWGRPAQKKIAMLDPKRHRILTAPHPSPLSASRGFFGCRHFSQANAHLQKCGQAPINWTLG